MNQKLTSPRFRHALCVYPYRRELNEAGFFPPLGLEYIAAAVLPYTESLDLVDLRQERERTADFLRPETDLVCFSVNWDRDRDFLAGELQSVPTGVFIVVGGRHATEDPQRWLAEFPNVDVVVRGDGEEAMDEICRGVALERTAGISFRSNGRIVHNANRTPGPLRDDLYPRRHLRRHKYPFLVKGVKLGMLVDAVAASRGCPFNCKFCSFNLNPWGEKRKWSARSPESVVDELAETEARLVGFTDDLFTHDMDWVERICDLLIRRGIRKRYFINARLEVANRPDVLRKMERAGFSMLMLGIESAHDKTLRSMRKGFGTDQVRRHFEVLRRSSMILHGYFILGCVGETPEDMLRIAPFAREIGVDTLALSTLRTVPYSGLEKLIAGSPGYHISHSGKVYSDDCSVSDIRQLRRRIYHEFYSPTQIGRIIVKGIRNDALSFLPAVIPHAAEVAKAMVVHAWQKSRRRAERRRAGQGTGST
jgi:anaerobic magnesium-protoporphyrin IX monomethyl ester cyclase